VGDVWSDPGGGLGRINHGNYAVLDLSAWVFLDAAKHHRLGARLENALDSEYATRITRVRTDVTNASYAAWNVGVPLTLHVTYRIGF
jgi:hypothetical protein